MNTKRLGRVIRNLRKTKGWTQQELAVQLGVVVTTVSRWETNTSKPSPLAIERIESTLGGMDGIVKENREELT